MCGTPRRYQLLRRARRHAGTPQPRGALPVRLGVGGIESVEQPTLSVTAQVALDTAMQL